MAESNPNLDQAASALHRLSQWCSVLAAWQLGTKSKGSPTNDAVQDHRYDSLNLRADMDALVALLISKGVISREEYMAALAAAADSLNRQYEKKFPGVQATDGGLKLNRELAGPWMAKLPQ